MRYRPLDKSLYIRNREKLVDLLKPNSLAIFHSNDIMPTNADGTMPFRQNNDLLYLSGIDQEETVLVICPDFPNEDMREILFIRETNEHIAIWEGHKYTKEEAFEASGIKNIQWVQNFDGVVNTLAALSENIYLNTNEHLRADAQVESRDARQMKAIREKYPLHHYHRAAPLMHQLRAIKEDLEITQMQVACDITEKAFRRVLSFVKPGVMEYEIEAEYMHEFLRNGSRGFAYTPIIASGANACVLHYIENSRPCNEGDLILFDVGAEYGNYNADMSRTIPVNGRFTKRQREVYDAVLRVQRGAFDILRPGTNIQEYHKEVGRIMESELIGLGLLDRNDVKNQDPKQPLYKKYFMHGTSHHIGLDVHDVGTMYEPIRPGMVFTVEPGIYIQEEGLGIRLENDIVIEEDGFFDLMRNIPIEAEEIEGLMNK
ncbi:aminopeptidase P N-terminal domain-containing protein [Litoribacter ruber]|uniref:aminopeptidase P N-terminal domain-containing protein n=1 Tax=Litoribacter ruber TaxID=702568 RepID=UPI001BDA17CB|nr:aminopeptidase P N-terminal domain-containing protein [Litoribacter ruber]MBT0811844.1 aminopeptidase P N-terminal domain-containing protein [Litoribacter ruber]